MTNLNFEYNTKIDDQLYFIGTSGTTFTDKIYGDVYVLKELSRESTHWKRVAGENIWDHQDGEFTSHETIKAKRIIDLQRIVLTPPGAERINLESELEKKLGLDTAGAAAFIEPLYDHYAKLAKERA
ncbi:MAG: hypothetical protein V1725_01915 [archaeon]